MAEEKTSVLNLKTLSTVKNSEQHPCLIVISGKGAGRLFKLDGSEAVVGRGVDTAIRIDDDGISRRHAKLVFDSEGRVHVEDLGSTNGTFVNGQRTDERMLQDGDKIELGSTTILKFSYTDNIEEEYQRNLYDSATRDPLTGCYNKKFFLERLGTEFSYANRHNANLSLCILDLDHFKLVNDTHGHPAGDSVLKHFAQVVLSIIRGEDIACRYGGEEFALILRNTPNKDAAAISERVRASLEQRVCSHEGTPIPVTCSVGVATLQSQNYTDSQSLLQAADDNLYRAKDAGRNRVVAQ